MAEATMTEVEGAVAMRALLKDLSLWLGGNLERGGFGALRDQASEYAEQIALVLAGDPATFYMTERVYLLERVAATAHQLTSEHGLPGQLRDAARAIEAIHTALGTGSYRGWECMGGLATADEGAGDDADGGATGGTGAGC